MEKIKANLVTSEISSNSKSAHHLFEKSKFGEKIEDKVHYLPVEALFLLEEKKLEVFQRGKKLTKQALLDKLQKSDKKIQTKYLIFKDLRKKGYIVKTALKFGAEFRVYDKGKKPGKTHAKWLVITDKESSKAHWHEFSSKNRVAHSTRKNLLLALVDEEGKIIYYEIKWIKP